MPTPAETFVLIYARASSDPDDLRVSVDHQLTRGGRYAAEHWSDATVLTFRDDDITAAKPGVVRPGFNAFCNAVRTLPKGSIVGIVANEQSRLTRLGETGWDDIAAMCSLAEVDTVHSLKEGPISVKQGARLVGTLLAAIHRETAERIAADVRNTHAELFREGRPSGRAPFGYLSAKDDGGRPKFVIDADREGVVRDVFGWALDGVALAVIADKLNAAGVVPRSSGWKLKGGGKRTSGWKAATVRALLRSPTVAGLRAHTDADGVLHTVPAKWDPIIDQDTWQRVQRVLGAATIVTGANGQTYRVRTMPAPKPRRYLLSGGRRRGVNGQPGEMYGVLRCGKVRDDGTICGYPLVAQTQRRRNGTRVPAYQCHPKVHPDACGGVSISPADEVEATIVAAVQARLVASKKVRKLLDATTDGETAQWRTERDAAKARMLDASQLLGAGTIDRDDFAVMHGAAKATYAAAVARLDALTSEATLPSADDVVHRWDGLTLAQQRAAVERLIDRIVIAPATPGRQGFDRSRIGRPVWRQ